MTNLFLQAFDFCFATFLFAPIGNSALHMNVNVNRLLLVSWIAERDCVHRSTNSEGFATHCTGIGVLYHLVRSHCCHPLCGFMPVCLPKRHKLPIPIRHGCLVTENVDIPVVGQELEECVF